MEITASVKETQKRVEIFCCYAHEDQKLLQELEKHLMPLKREGLIALWADRDMNAGAEWEKEIHLHLNTSHIILLLISPDFMSSDYCYSTEMTQAMDRHKSGQAQVIPVILRSVDWQHAPFAKLQALPHGAHPIVSSEWADRDEGFANVARGIREAIAVAFVKEEQHGFAEDMKGASVHKQEETHISVDTKNPQALPLIVEKPSPSLKRSVIFRPMTRRNAFLVAVVLILLSASFASIPWGIIKARLSGLSLTLSPATNSSATLTPSFYGDPQLHPPQTALISCGGARSMVKDWKNSSPVFSYDYTGPDNRGHYCTVHTYVLTPPQHTLVYFTNGDLSGGQTIPLAAKSLNLWIYISPVWHSAQAQYILQFDGLPLEFDGLPSHIRTWPPLDQRFCDHWLILGNAPIPQNATHVRLIVESTNTTSGYFADNAVALDFHNFIPTSSAIQSTIQQCKKR